jgi:hypothetical protein
MNLLDGPKDIDRLRGQLDTIVEDLNRLIEERQKALLIAMEPGQLERQQLARWRIEDYRREIDIVAQKRTDLEMTIATMETQLHQARVAAAGPEPAAKRARAREVMAACVAGAGRMQALVDELEKEFIGSMDLYSELRTLHRFQSFVTNPVSPEDLGGRIVEHVVHHSPWLHGRMTAHFPMTGGRPRRTLVELEIAALGLYEQELSELDRQAEMARTEVAVAEVETVVEAEAPGADLPLFAA